MTLTFEEARACVLGQVQPHTIIESVPLHEAGGRVLACDAHADRDIPALDRSVRDGFALRAADAPGTLRIIGEARAGSFFPGTVHAGEAVEIMTGAPLPAGADSVVMIEHVALSEAHVAPGKAVPKGQFVSFRAEEAHAGQLLVPAGRRLSYPTLALLAATGHHTVQVFAKPRVAILATGDELVAISHTPTAHQIRNSNVYSLAFQVTRAGGIPEILPVAPDRQAETRALIERGLTADLLLLSGGVSAGKYDLVEHALSSLGATFFFDRALIQPGAPVVFGHSRDRFFFGLPGNPASTMVTFEIFARAAIDRLGGCPASPLPIALGRLTTAYRHKPGLTRFLPAILSGEGLLTPLPWKGSSDIPAVSRANAFLIASSARLEWREGDTIPVLAL